jgi:hypothetical protein
MGTQGAARSIFQIGGQLLGGAIDPAIKAVEHATPDFVKKGLGTLFKPVGTAISAAGSKIADIPAIQRVADSPQGDAIDRDVQAFNEFLNLVPLPGAGRVAGAAGKVGEVAADATKGALTVPAGPFRKSYLPAVDQAFKDEGIKAPISAITKSPFLQGAENIAAKSAFGRKIVDQVKTAENQIEAKTNEIVARITPQKAISDENLGKTLQEGLREYEHHFKATEEKVYAQFQKKYGKANSTANTTRDVLHSIVTEQGKDFFKGIEPRFARMLDTLSGETKEIAGMRQQGLPDNVIEQQRNPPILSFDELKATRTSVGEQLARDPENTALKRLYGALSEDMTRAVSEIDPHVGGKALAKLNADYASGKNKIESHIASSIEQSNPERIAQNLIKRNSADTLRVVKEMVGNNRFAEVSKAFMRQQMESAVTRGKFDVAKLKAQLGEYDQATMNELLTPDQLKDLNEAVASLERLHSLTDALKPGKRFAEGSQTAFLQEIRGMGARTTAFLTALLTGQVGIASGILFGTGLEAAYAKLFTTDVGRKFLTEGLFSKRGASISNYIGKSRPLFGAPQDTAKPRKALLPKKLRTVATPKDKPSGPVDYLGGQPPF